MPTFCRRPADMAPEETTQNSGIGNICIGLKSQAAEQAWVQTHDQKHAT